VERVGGGKESEGERMCLPGVLLHPIKKMGKERMEVF
jgi:hypothetical protein